MFKYILVPASGCDTDEPVFRAALAVARLAAGHLEFLHVRLDMQDVVLSVAGGDFGGGAGIGDVIETIQLEVEARQTKAHDAVVEFCRQANVAMIDAPQDGMPSADWRVEAGDEAQLIAAFGRTADLIVLGRARDGEPVALNLLEAALLDSGRPLLIVPEQPPAEIGRHIAIAWKDTAEAARATAAALPLLHRAHAVTIVSVAEDARTDADSCERLRHALLWHNPNAKLRHVTPAGREPVDVMLGVTEEIGADLLVMGGYSHSRMRESVFGGFTRRVLRSAGLTVLMAH